ncbi:hypothetical protein ASG60_15150 [Methylobacterium sp. Leaf469]|nr:hypothetical protein ASF22_21760 [Methylobacterium sp. Leaf87]KQP17334.1 hypothetical protein ASF25_12600 [Methylobacterium sp. Leaf100]KQP22308.1 hypothetical protein ASF27_14545 [Methylobacterium sp. Leaf102]KQT86778.1 hypothetical protein ASG60_15150 [Methylobacterium sp. Leaf469]
MIEASAARPDLIPIETGPSRPYEQSAPLDGGQFGAGAGLQSTGLVPPETFLRSVRASFFMGCMS